MPEQAALLLSFIAILISGLFGHIAPPPSPTMPSASVAAVYHARAHDLLLFGMLTAIGTTLAVLAYCLVSVATLHIRPRSRMLAMLQIATVAFVNFGAFPGVLFITAAAVRPDNASAVVAALNAIGVIFIEMTPLPTALTAFAAVVASSATLRRNGSCRAG